MHDKAIAKEAKQLKTAVKEMKKCTKEPQQECEVAESEKSAQ